MDAGIPNVLRRVVLASISPRRLQLLQSLQLDVLVVPSRYEEPAYPQLLPSELALVHARCKCNDVRARFADDVVVGADTVVDVESCAYNKPKDDAEAKWMLAQLSGRTHCVHTAFAIALPHRAQLLEHRETTRVTFCSLTDAQIDDYVRSGDCLDKAGAYGVQGYGAALVERTEGDFYAVMGFPVGPFVRALQRLGFALPITNGEARRFSGPG